MTFLYLQPNRLSDEGMDLRRSRDVKPDFIIVAAFGQILPKKYFGHCSLYQSYMPLLLPQYRGASPVQQSLLNGDEKTGVTSMMMEEGLGYG